MGEPRSRVRPLRKSSIDGRRNFGHNLRRYATPSGFLGMIAARAGLDLPAPDPPFVDEETDPAPARIHQDKWIVGCPVEGCGDASFVWLEEPLYMCANCFNEELGGRWRRVAVPPVEERERIEAVLAGRALPQQRNWDPSESLDDLRAQNGEHGDPVPEEA